MPRHMDMAPGSREAAVPRDRVIRGRQGAAAAYAVHAPCGSEPPHALSHALLSLCRQPPIHLRAGKCLLVAESMTTRALANMQTTPAAACSLTPRPCAAAMEVPVLPRW